MTYDKNFGFDESYSEIMPKNINEAHLIVIFLLDVSSSMSGARIASLQNSINRFKEDVCKDTRSAARMEVCIIAFNHDQEVLQSFRPVDELETVHLHAGGGTNISAAVKKAIELTSARTRLHESNGTPLHVPVYVLITDAEDEVSDEVVALIDKRTSEKKMKVMFLGVEGFNKTTAARICKNKKVFVPIEGKDHDFTDFFRMVAGSMKAISQSAVGEEMSFKYRPTDFEVIDVGDWIN